MARTWSPDDPVGEAEWATCRLCGRRAEDVRVALAGIRRDDRRRSQLERGESLESPDFRAFAKCGNRDECRWRREAQGKDWPLVDAARAVPPDDADDYLTALKAAGQSPVAPAPIMVKVDTSDEGTGEPTALEDLDEEEHPWLR